MSFSFTSSLLSTPLQSTRPRISSFSGPAGDRSRVPSLGSNEARSRVPSGEMRASVPSGEMRSRLPSGEMRSRLPSGEMRARIPSISMRTYKPHLITERRRRVEDLCRFPLLEFLRKHICNGLSQSCVRDLVVNNDHIHVMEMRLRAALAKVSFNSKFNLTFKVK